ncbi:DNA ligase 6 isoform X2 [Jatropha curcas]|uniref:DNA ligase 6 isoform X2 n=1 Tax=Jatropha curcas TaxID=180498 RepID=UPI0009D6F79D|nr:DNA ligase 6 isoform X2 [Jatropha curcas]
METSTCSSKPPQTLDSLQLYQTSLASLSVPIHSDHRHHLSSFPLPSSLPSSKVIPNTRFLVDAFRYATSSTVTYFLSHFHSDHYTGLSSNWCQGLIFCSPTTANLLTQVLKIPSQFVFPLPLREPVIIDGSEVTLIDANHCPGAVLFLFKVPGKNQASFKMYIHTGDFRYCGSMQEDSLLSQFFGCDTVFLDTTYCDPKFVFPSQEESIDYIVGVIDRIGEKYMGQERTVLFLVATYVVGKERILLEIARRCKRKVHVDGRKMEVLRVLGHGESGMFTEDETESDVHVVGWNVLGETWPYFRPNFVKMKEIMVERRYSKVVGFVPTGWTYEATHKKNFPVRSKETFEIHLVPYSEHSNYDELMGFVKFLRPKRVIPTVGVDIEKLDSKAAIKMQKHFAGLVDEMANKKEFLMGFHRGSLENDEKVEMEDVSGLSEGLGQEKGAASCEVNTLEDKDLGVILNSSTILQECGSNLAILNDEGTKKIIQELSDCLPSWVTRDQMLDLINNSEGNFVDAVSNFYDNETQFHQQVFKRKASISSSHNISISSSPASIPNGPEALSKPVSIKSSQESLSSPLSQNLKSSNTKPSVKSRITPAKRKNVENKHRKKVKPNPKLESGGPKQSTITRFFNKIVPKVSTGSVVEFIPEQCPVDEKSLPNDDTISYKQEINQFIQIIDGNNSLRGYAATMLERTKGDISKALDIHYGNPEGNFDKSVVRLVASGDSIQPQCHTNEFSSAQEKTVSEEEEHMIDLSLKRALTGNVAPTYVALPPEKYIPIQHACWKAGEPAPYIHLARTFDLAEAEKGKIKATSMLCNMFRSLLALSPEDVLPAVYLCTNKIAADHENIELNIGGSLVTSAIEEACGTNRSKIRDMYNSLGDLGDVAQLCRQTQTLLAPPSQLLIKDVFSVLRKISAQTGTGSTAQKKSLIVNLMRSCKEKEMKFIVRTLVRNLRIGAMMKTVLPALAQAVALNSLANASEEQKVDLKEKLQI